MHRLRHQVLESPRFLSPILSYLVVLLTGHLPQSLRVKAPVARWISLIDSWMDLAIHDICEAPSSASPAARLPRLAWPPSIVGETNPGPPLRAGFLRRLLKVSRHATQSIVFQKIRFHQERKPGFWSHFHLPPTMIFVAASNCHNVPSSRFLPWKG